MTSGLASTVTAITPPSSELLHGSLALQSTLPVLGECPGSVTVALSLFFCRMLLLGANRLVGTVPDSVGNLTALR
jgi:hypothetical protein